MNEMCLSVGVCKKKQTKSHDNAHVHKPKQSRAKQITLNAMEIDIEIWKWLSFYV